MQKIKEILLVKPYRFVATPITLKEIPYPLGLGYLAAVLEKKWNVNVIDIDLEGLSEEEFSKKVEDLRPQMVGISSMFSENHKYAHNVARVVKEIDPKIIVVMGGVHVTCLPHAVLEDKNVDFILVGEGESSFPQLIECLNAKGDVKKVEGVGFCEDGKVYISPNRPFIHSLDEIPFPARHLFPFDKYTRTARKYYTRPRRFPFTHMITSRGCLYSCTFCAVRKISGKGYRARSAENVLAEVKELVENYGIREIHFYDDNITIQKSRFLKILEGLKRYKIGWVPLNLGVKQINEEILEKMKESGCYRIVISIESGSERVLREVMNKDIDLEKVRKIVKFARCIDLEVIGAFVIGMPGESMKEIYQTVHFAEELELDYFILSIATPYPGTRLLEICKEKGLLVDDFSLEKLGISRGCIKTSQFSPEDLERIRKEEWRRIIFSSEEKIQRLMKITGMSKKEMELWQAGEESLVNSEEIEDE
jgi:radical SAM superfamily enzyme YgiQ (UPF0313 family)